jgi:hypothetical protein
MGLTSGGEEFPGRSGLARKGPIPVFAEPNGQFLEREPRERITSSVSTVSSWLMSPVPAGTSPPDSPSVVPREVNGRFLGGKDV